MQIDEFYLSNKTIDTCGIIAHPQVDLYLAYGSTNNRGSIVFLTERQPQEKVSYNFYNQYQIQRYNQVNKIYQKQDAQIMKLIPTSTIFISIADNINCAAFSPNGKYLAMVGQKQGQDDQLIIYELQNCSDFWNQFQKILKLKFSFSLLNHEASCICFTKDNNFILVGTMSGVLIQYKLSSTVPMQLMYQDEIKIKGSETKEVKILNGQILSIDVSSDSYMIFAQGHQETGFLIKQLQKQGDKVKYLKGGKINKCNGKIIENKELTECIWQEQPDKERPMYLPRGLEKHLINGNLLRTIYSIPLYKRQLAISPDSNFVVIPSGLTDIETYEQKASCTFSTYVISRKSLCTSSQNFDVVLPGFRYPTTTVVFSDKLYKLDPNKENVTNLQYRMIFAVLSGTDTYIYDTQTFECLAEYQGINYQLDYVYSAQFSSYQPELLVFGSHYQFQKINFRDLNLQLIQPTSPINLSQKLKSFKVALQHQKYNYAMQLAAYYNKKRKSRPSKPNQIYLSEIQSENRQIPQFLMSNLFQFDSVSSHQLQVDREELEFIWDLCGVVVSDTAPTSLAIPTSLPSSVPPTSQPANMTASGSVPQPNIGTPTTGPTSGMRGIGQGTEQGQQQDTINIGTTDMDIGDSAVGDNAMGGHLRETQHIKDVVEENQNQLDSGSLEPLKL